MRNLIVAAIVTMMAAAPAAAQTDQKAADILKASRQAIGGSRLDGIKTFSVQSNLQRNMGQMQMAADLELLVELPDKYYRGETFTSGMGGGMTSGFNGERPLTRSTGGAPGGAMIIRMGPGGPMGGGGEKLSPEDQAKADATAVRASRIDLTRLMLGWFAMAHPSVNATYTFAGEAESPDGKAFIIDVAGADAFAARLFVDEATHLPLMLTYKGPQPRTIRQSGGATSREELQKQIDEMSRQPPPMADYTLFFDDWQDVDGIKFPFKLRRAMSGTTTEEWSVGKVKVNPRIDPRKFSVEG